MKNLAARGDIYKEDNSIPVAEVQHEPFHDAAINGDSVKELISQGQREAAKLGAFACLPLLLPPISSVPAQSHSPGTLYPEIRCEEPVTRQFRIDQEDFLLDLKSIHDMGSSLSSLNSTEVNAAYDSTAAGLGEIFSKKIASGKAILTPELSNKLSNIEHQLSHDGISAEHKRELYKSAVEMFNERVMQCGTDAGWSKSQSKELAKLILCLGKTGEVCSSFLEDAGKSNGVKASHEDLAESLKFLRIFSEESYIEAFGLIRKEMVYVSHIIAGKPYSNDNGCGPAALYYLIQLEKGDDKFTTPRAQQKLYDELYRLVAPGTLGSDPGRLPTAVRTVTHGEFDLKLHDNEDWAEAQRTIDATLEVGRPCVVKYGSSLLQQHYDCIRGMVEAGGIKVYASTSGYLIPESRLAAMMSQWPYSNQVWTAFRP